MKTTILIIAAIAALLVIEGCGTKPDPNSEGAVGIAPSLIMPTPEEIALYDRWMDSTSWYHGMPSARGYTYPFPSIRDAEKYRDGFKVVDGYIPGSGHSTPRQHGIMLYPVNDSVFHAWVDTTGMSRVIDIQKRMRLHGIEKVDTTFL
ncbi:MAG TPA: hypothetical protein PK916_08735 [Bacteroidota bacterium]|nr:hypothetical protein [Bacteroidota bacterium]